MEGVTHVYQDSALSILSGCVCVQHVATRVPVSMCSLGAITPGAVLLTALLLCQLVFLVCT